MNITPFYVSLVIAVLIYTILTLAVLYGTFVAEDGFIRDFESHREINFGIIPIMFVILSVVMVITSTSLWYVILNFDKFNFVIK